MSLKEQIMADIKTAMKDKAQAKLDTLRFLHSAIKNKEIESRPNEISDADVVSVIQKSVKQRKESILQFTNAGRTELAAKEESEIKILEIYLPTLMSEAEVTKVVEQMIKETGASGAKDMGKVMKAVLAKLSGQADNSVVSKVVKAKLV